MKTKMIIEHISSDRNIVLFFNEQGILDGVNFWQGTDDFSIANSFIENSDENISEYISQIGTTHRYEALHFIDDIDQGIWNYLDSKNREDVEILSYIEDGELVIALRSLKKFNGAYFDGEFYFKYFTLDELTK
jgi:hypothetical protein